MKSKHRLFSKLHSLKHTSLLAFILSFLLPSFLLILLLLFFFIYNTTKSQEKEYRNTLQILSSHLANHIDSNSGLSLSYLFDPEVSRFYYFLNRKEYTDNLTLYTQLAQSYTSTLNTRMTLIGDSITGIGFIPYQNNKDLLFYQKKYSALQIREDYDYTSSAWYQKLHNNNQTVLFIPSETALAPNSISLIRSVRNIDKQQVVGYIILDISMDFILESLKEIIISKYSGIFLESPHGALLFSTNIALNDTLSTLLDADTNTSYIQRQYDLYTFTEDSYGFTFHYLSSRNSLYESILFASKLVLLFYIVMIVLAAFIFSAISLKINHSITPILDTMDKYHAGDSHIQCDTSQCSISEISSIAVNLNEMIEKINIHIDNEYRSKMEQKIAEYQALQAEINPHFLHNILNLLLAQNRLGDKTSLEQSIVSLSRLFRYTCEHKYDSSIKQEFDFIRDYLYLQQVRFEERLHFEISVEPGLEDFKIPKLLIQPLIENAIVHGLEPSDQNEFIQLTALTLRSKNEGAFVVITVINSGLPYMENKSYKRVGLQNIEDRLTLFSPNSFFFIRGGIDKPTKCTIMIPDYASEHNIVML